jgi:hypothetical protein
VAHFGRLGPASLSQRREKAAGEDLLQNYSTSAPHSSISVSGGQNKLPSTTFGVPGFGQQKVSPAFRACPQLTDATSSSRKVDSSAKGRDHGDHSISDTNTRPEEQFPHSYRSSQKNLMWICAVYGSCVIRACTCTISKRSTTSWQGKVDY